jgi:mannose-6-phosphate isomerase-like protein (cupin superfamily)
MRSLTVVLATLTALLAVRGRSAAQQSVTPLPFKGDVEKLARQNSDFRRVLFTGGHVQIVAMSLPPDEDIGPEVHRVDQCFFFVEGGAKTMIDGRAGSAKENDVLCVPAGMRHNIRNAGRKPLKLYTLYSPPQHPAGAVQHTKAPTTVAPPKRGRGPQRPATPPSPGRWDW